MPRRSSPSVTSSATMAGPLSVRRARGSPRFWIAWASPWTRSSAVSRGTTGRGSRVASGRRGCPGAIGCSHGPGVGEHLERAVVEVEVPQRPDVLGLVAANLAGLASGFGDRLARVSGGLWLGFAYPAVSLHVSFDGGIGTQPPQRRIGLHQGGEVVVVQLVAPVGVLAVLEQKPLGQSRGQRDLAAVLADGARKAATGSSSRRSAV